jgi:hypothetical protein
MKVRLICINILFYTIRCWWSWHTTLHVFISGASGAYLELLRTESDKKLITFSYRQVRHKMFRNRITLFMLRCVSLVYYLNQIMMYLFLSVMWVLWYDILMWTLITRWSWLVCYVSLMVWYPYVNPHNKMILTCLLCESYGMISLCEPS